MQNQVNQYIDCITYELIDPSSLISIKEGESVYHFDVHTLLRRWRETNKLENPCTTRRLPEDVIGRMEGAMTNAELVIQCEGIAHKYDTRIPVGKLIVELCKHKITTHDVLYHGQSLYNYALTQSVGTIPRHQNALTCQVQSPTSSHNLAKMLSYLVPLQHDNSIKVLVDIINNELKYGRVVTN